MPHTVQPKPFWLRNRERREAEPRPLVPHERREVMDAALDEVARQHPTPLEPETFVEQLRRFAVGADHLMSQLRDTHADLRATVADNVVLRARQADLEKHIDMLNTYWSDEWEKINDRYQTLCRLHYSLTSRLDGAVDFMTSTREDARREAFGPEEPEQPAMQPSRPVVERHPADPDDDPDGVLARLARPQVNRRTMPPPEFVSDEPRR